MEITPRPGSGLITIAQAATLTGKSKKTVHRWTTRGYLTDAGEHVTVPARRDTDNWTLLVDPVDIAKANWATTPKRLRPILFPRLAPAA